MSRYESEISSILGMLVVAALAVFIFLFIKKFMPKPSISPVAETTEQEDLLKKEETGSTYTVKKNQGLSQIAQEVYKDGRMWKKIADANNLKPPYNLEKGQVLKLPDAAAKTEAKAAVAVPATTAIPAPKKESKAVTVNPTQTVTPQGESYAVVKGDSLWKIAQAQYGNGYAWVKIYRANKKLIGKNPGLIHVGTELVLPQDKE